MNKNIIHIFLLLTCVSQIFGQDGYISDVMIDGLDIGFTVKGNTEFDFKSGLFTATDEEDLGPTDASPFDDWEINKGRVGGGYTIDINSLYNNLF